MHEVVWDCGSILAMVSQRSIPTRTDEAAQRVAWKWNWLRQSLVESARSFAGMAVRSADASAARSWSDLEARFLQVAGELAATLRAAGLPQVHIHRPLQWYFCRHLEAAELAEPQTLIALSRVVLRRLVEWTTDENQSGDFRDQLEAEVDKCRALADELSARLEAGSSDEEVNARLARLREVDRCVCHDLRPFEDALWQLPGLGRSRDVAVDADELVA